ncbi:hypothetical protein MJO28_015656 [Puccinia striiformis f. sp. tritici]|uniref:Uncharacterized protein n=1 Tax=Puccinia striiformis f. sp. tritici TaxID=168172 RepID=A0ACC0DPY0_9BASI|nr:hypothetical protein Pst134EA_029360 [Puccinia striiformis f. sp. tritici]KAH9447322.1 hypothetical protein Pst134EA_029360 [Puccinia striiformis f. sp. tritici]KAI7936426.1 hypothetical protein MJO29_015729 [Puccinia striiformis f. sp. tritici]KAI7936757.1 hypothetical protein MJO28_015656 [Puccinia striiformis f. sp. tritici]
MASAHSSVTIDSLVENWLQLDRNPTTRKEIEQLHQDKNYDALADRLCQRIKFGTAGLRAHMSAGFSRMNDVTVIQASQGLAAYLIKDIPKATQQGIVVGHDHRHNSERFARLAVTAFLRKGFKCYLLDGPVATPMVPFGVKYVGAAAGVMVTASHNPAADNGYKLYYSNAVQIISPHDKGIAASIEQNLDIDEEAWSTEPTPGVCEELMIHRTKEIQDAYFNAIAGLVKHSRLENSKTALKFVYTPMHGVGYPFATKACIEIAGFPDHAWLPVQAQKNPDPDFPTVKFPNPEEKGALDMAMSLGNEILEKDHDQKVMIIANDPDADRFCAAEWSGSQWTTFSGDQIGAVFACWTLENYKKSGNVSDIAMLSSTVSSHLVAQIARQEGFKFRETLTGFKNLGNAALNLEKEGYKVLFAYEEALGYMFQTGIFDKDGIAATIVWAELATELAGRGSSVADYLETIYQKYGYFATNNSYFVCKDPCAVKTKFQGLRYGEQSAGEIVEQDSRSVMLGQLRFPRTLAGYPITRIRDLTIAYDDSYPPQCVPDLPSSSDEMITFYFGGHGGEVIATLRTSGTESWKLKYYVEGSAQDQVTAQNKVDQIVEAIGEEWGFSNL